MLSEHFMGLGRDYDAEAGRHGWWPTRYALGDASYASVMVVCRRDERIEPRLGAVAEWWLSETSRNGERFVSGPKPTLALTLHGWSSSGSERKRLGPSHLNELTRSLAAGSLARGGWMLNDFGADTDGYLGEARADIDLEDAGWLQFEASLGVVGRSGVETGVVEFWSRLLEILIATCNVTYAQISPEPGGFRVTDWELSLGAYGSTANASSEQGLRGFGWLTFVPDAVLDRLGGIDALGRSGAFDRVDPEAGGALLRAAQGWSEFDDGGRAKIEEALGPALLRGVT